MPSYCGSDIDALFRYLTKAFKCEELTLKTLPAEQMTEKGDDLFAVLQPYIEGKKYVDGEVLITRGLSFQLVVDAVIHEIAHYLDQRNNVKFRDEHRNSWGVMYSKVYREHLKYFKDLKEENKY